MTTPAEPGTGAGTPATGEKSPQPPATTDPQPGQQPATGTEPSADWSSIDWGELSPQEVKEKLDHARTWEKRAKTNKEKLDALASQQTAPKEGDPTAEDLQQQLAEEREAREAAETAALEAAYTSTVTRVAAQVGADAEALLDSDSFYKAVGDELGDDEFDDDDLKAAITKAAKEYAKKPRFAATGGSPRGPADLGNAGGQPAGRQRPTSLGEAVKRHYG